MLLCTIRVRVCACMSTHVLWPAMHVKHVCKDRSTRALTPVRANAGMSTTLDIRAVAAESPSASASAQDYWTRRGHGARTAADYLLWWSAATRPAALVNILKMAGWDQLERPCISRFRVAMMTILFWTLFTHILPEKL